MKTMRCLDCYWFKWSFLTGKHTEIRSICGIHGGTKVTPRGPQHNLDTAAPAASYPSTNRNN